MFKVRLASGKWLKGTGGVYTVVKTKGQASLFLAKEVAWEVNNMRGLYPGAKAVEAQ